MQTVLRFRVDLQDIAPAIWRRFELPADADFWDLHVAIQDVMGWQDRHLHVFRVSDARGKPVEIGTPDALGERAVTPGWRRALARHFKQPGDQARYEYDFGDGWRHVVLLEGLLLAEPGATYPRCLAGGRRCPPEDCGGPPGYEHLLEALADKHHPAHKDLVAWHGGTFDPAAFDPAGVRFSDPEERLKAHVRH